VTIVRLWLVHHADALGPAEDPLRPLSEPGHRQAQHLAERARDAGCSPAAIWHSGKLRSRQTAEAFLRLCNPFAEFRMVRGLRPDDPPEWMRNELAAETREVLLVGHMPNIAALARVLAPAGGPFPLHGLIAFERTGSGAWRELRRFAVDCE
jgi:phosphohistidine phosphatase